MSNGNDATTKIITILWTDLFLLDAVGVAQGVEGVVNRGSSRRYRGNHGCFGPARRETVLEKEGEFGSTVGYVLLLFVGSLVQGTDAFLERQQRCVDFGTLGASLTVVGFGVTPAFTPRQIDQR